MGDAISQGAIMTIQAMDSGKYREDQAFFTKVSTCLAVFIVFGFVQWALRGMVDYGKVPIWVHLHGLLMVSFLALFVTQNRLAGSGNLALHRKLGWISAYLVAVIVGVACFTGVMAVKLHKVPPFFSDAYFLALTQVDAVVFGGLVYAAITRRKETEFHRRLMIGAVIVTLEPALGRLLPMPFMNGMGEWVALVIQLGVVTIIALHDRRVLGYIHPATATAGAIVAMSHVLIELSANNATVQGIAASIAGG